MDHNSAPSGRCDWRTTVLPQTGSYERDEKAFLQRDHHRLVYLFEFEYRSQFSVFPVGWKAWKLEKLIEDFVALYSQR